VYLQCDPFPIALPPFNARHADSTTGQLRGYQNDSRNGAWNLIGPRHNAGTGVLTYLAGGPKPTLENQTKRNLDVSTSEAHTGIQFRLTQVTLGRQWW